MIFRKWKIILFEIELISVYWMLSGERDFFLKNWIRQELSEEN